jgi:hypothetical protein
LKGLSGEIRGNPPGRKVVPKKWTTIAFFYFLKVLFKQSLTRDYFVIPKRGGYSKKWTTIAFLFSKGLIQAELDKGLLRDPQEGRLFKEMGNNCFFLFSKGLIQAELDKTFRK